MLSFLPIFWKQDNHLDKLDNIIGTDVEKYECLKKTEQYIEKKRKYTFQQHKLPQKASFSKFQFSNHVNNFKTRYSVACLTSLYSNIHNFHLQN